VTLFRALIRRRTRTILALLGVAIAVFSLVILGAVSERIRLHITNGERYYGSYAWVLDAQGIWFGSRLEAGLRDEIEGLAGVRYAAHRVLTTPKQDEFFSGNPLEMSAVVGVDLDPKRCVLREMHLIAGRQMEPGSLGECVLGYGAAEQYHKSVGDSMDVRGRPLEVVGILDLIGSDPDQAIFTSIEEARKSTNLRDDEVTLIAVRLEDGADENVVADAIRALRPDSLLVLTPSKIEKQITAAVGLFNAMVYGCGIVAMVIGTLGVANTMAFSVGERAREIATKKAIGARTSDIFREFLFEAVVLSVGGSLVGIALGYGGAALLNHFIGVHGLPIFIVTPRLVGLAAAVALAVGTVAGVWPALQAARTDPVRILRNS
jgi:putative ABC transport system permease protein